IQSTSLRACNYKFSQFPLRPDANIFFRSQNISMQFTQLIKEVIPRTPLLVSTVVNHITKGPPAPSWDLKFHLLVAFVKDHIAKGKVTIERIQEVNNREVPLPDFVTSTPVTIPNIYRNKAGDLLEPLLAPHDSTLGWDWRRDLERETTPQLTGEWLDIDTEKEQAHREKKTHGGKTVMNVGNKEGKRDNVILYVHGGAYYLCSIMTHRHITWRLSKYGKARTFAFNYRLAPQHPFPAALEDALAAYLYLLDPPADAGFQPVNPKRIVVAGDSAGGGLTMATLLAIRDAGLPAPAGAVLLSPWVDLTQSFPSVISNSATDYLPDDLPSPVPDFDQLPKKQLEAETEIALVANTADAEAVQFKRLQLYAPNEALRIPYVSPVFDPKGLTGLPPLLLQAGTGERLRDEAFYTAYKASLGYPSAPAAAPSGLPATNVTFEIYIDMPHVFQMFTFIPQTSTAFHRIGEFVQRIIASPPETVAFTIFEVDGKGNATESASRVKQSEWEEWEKKLALSLKEKMDETEKQRMLMKKGQKNKL
ncbi:Alpha/Beta hydrolase protein, partial [Endogone sp. FLAS-F59071]